MKVWLIHHSWALRRALKRLSDTPFASLLGIFVIGLVFSLPAGGYMLLGNLQTVSRQISGAPQLSLFLALNADAADIREIEKNMGKHPEIRDFTFVPKGEALNQLRQNNDLGKVIDKLDKNPLPDAFIVNTHRTNPAVLEQLREEILKWRKVEHVQLDSAWAERLHAFLELGQSVLLILASLLGLVLIVIVYSTTRLQMLAMQDEIGISRLIGATHSFIRRPFLYFGAIQGAAGGVMAWLVIAICIHMVNDGLTGLSKLYTIDFALKHFSPEESAGLVFSAAASGWMGAWLSVTSHLWKTEIT